MSEALELLPCPFCGAKPRTSVFPDEFGGMQIECETANCPASGLTTGSALFDPLIPWQAWNTRTPDPRVAALVAALDDVASECTSDEIPDGYGPDMTENPEFHRGYDAALHRVRRALAMFKGEAAP